MATAPKIDDAREISSPSQGGAAQRCRGPLVLLGLLALALAIYLPYALNAGWYYDDWALYSIFKHAGSTWASQFDACTSTIPGGRKLTCLYHTTEYHLLGDHRTAYHLVAIGFLVAMSGLTYAILRRCRLAWPWAALVAALLIVFPASDSTRLWPTGAIGQYVIVLELIGVLVALAALRRPRGPAQIALHLTSCVVFIVAMSSYEIAVPLVALNGVIYWAACRDRAALKRGAVDFALALAFVFYRSAISPADPAEGFTVHRTLSGYFTRTRNLVEGAWHTWHEAFLPGRLGTTVLACLIAVALALIAVDIDLRRRLRPWGYMLAAAVVVAGGATFVFFTANDLYVPQMESAFNRVTLPGSIAYVCLFVGLLGVGYEIVRRISGRAWLAGAAVAIVVLASGWHQLRISSDHKSWWEASWREEKVALAGYRVAVRDIPHHSRLIGMGAPIWEPGYVPVFAATWDLLGAIDYTTSAEPAAATPLFPNMTCGRRGVVSEGSSVAPYRVPGEPLYFISSTHRRAIEVRSMARCEEVVASWGYPPYLAAP